VGLAGDAKGEGVAVGLGSTVGFSIILKYEQLLMMPAVSKTINDILNNLLPIDEL
jgi:hypothetical protein